ncbi:MAG: protein arginine kinase [Candidatus Omnitrophica bacterium]|nr:protein arginine kinase [Candidatus Omnitrophota bacterium]
MDIDNLIKHTSVWLKGIGPESDIAISSRVRLARNIDGLLFVDWSDDQTKSRVIELSRKAVLSSDYMKDAAYVDMSLLSPIDKQFLIERHLISREHAIDTGRKSVFISRGEETSIMVNEEDHLRLQVMQSGIALNEAWDIMVRLEKDIERKIQFAYSDCWGYLTACPTNTGTGLRASVMVHLPAIVMTRQINDLIKAVSKLGLTVRGFFGEGTEAIGNFFQISNQVTMGRGEEETIDNLTRIIKQVVSQERGSREFLKEKKRDIIEDKISRAYATLESAHIITSAETIDLLSLVRLGIGLGIIKDMDARSLNELFILIQPAHLQKMAGKLLPPSERDIKRAEIIKSRLKMEKQ